MAAEKLADAGLNVTIAESKPSPARKLLMAGKSGLNLTMDAALPDFIKAYPDAPPLLQDIIGDFGPNAVQDWARELGQEVFAGSSGRVFPKAMKASPLLRAWLARLASKGVALQTRWRWVGSNDGFEFDTPEGRHVVSPSVTVLATGGASWARLGSDGAWAGLLPEQAITPFQPANMGFTVDWSQHMARHFGSPVKGVSLRAGETYSRGEFIVSERGIEGGGIYAMSREMRLGERLTIDLLPDVTVQQLTKKLSRPRGKDSMVNFLRKSGLTPVKIALLREFGGPFSKFPEVLPQLIKGLHIAYAGPRPMDEAISTAGGVRFDALDDHLMLRELPGVFCAGEMLDWEAPTGGYLLTACLATGRHAGRAAAEYVRTKP